MNRINQGDVFLFTGQNMVRGVGEVGVIFQNADFADSLWRPDPGKNSWHNVYSLMRFQAVEIPYQEIWSLPGFNAGDNFMGLRVLDGEKAQVILQGLNIATMVSVSRELAEEEEVLAALSQNVKIIPVEGVHKTSTSYQQDARSVLVHRAEALLQNEYARTLGEEAKAQRVRMPVGITDLYVTGPGGIEIIEAKSGTSHKFVRDALGQLLDYAPHSPEPVDRLSGLFPSRLVPANVEFLHSYGIDCIYRTEPGLFARIPAPDEARAHMQKIWSRKLA